MPLTNTLDERFLVYGENGYGAYLYPDENSQDNENAIVRRALTPVPQPHLTGMKLKADVSLGSLVLNTIDSNGVVWVCTDIDGWWSHPDPDIPDVTRGWRDGSYDARGRWQARQLTLNGSFLPHDPSLLPAARDTLIRATNLVYTGAWLKTQENPTRASYVRLSGKPGITTVNARGRTDFSIGLRAADPIKYSWNESDPDGYDLETTPARKLGTVSTISYPTFDQRVAAGLPGDLYPNGAPVPLVKGNIDLSNRPLVANYGVVDTLQVYRYNDGSNEVLIPLVVGGAIVSVATAISTYTSTGQHLGKFASGNWQDAETYATNLQNIQDAWLEVVNYTYDGQTGSVDVDNVGNVDVSMFLEVTGPITGDATIVNETTGEVLTIISPLRGAEARTVTTKILTSNIATLTFSSTHTIVAGDMVTISGVDSVFNGEYEVTNVPASNQISYVVTASNVPSTASTGSAVRAADILEIDTYEREVAYNGVIVGSRVKVDTLTDWLVLTDGVNTITFTDEGNSQSTASLKVFYRSGWIG